MTETFACVSGAFAVSGAAVWWSGRKELIQRWLSWLVIVPLVGGAFWLGPPGAFALAAGVGLVAVLEYGHLLKLRMLDRALMGGALVGLPLIAWLAPEHLVRVLFGALLVAGLITLLERDPDRGMQRAYGVVFGLAWLAPLTGLVVLGDLAPPLCAAVAVADVAAWCGGKLLRGPTLSPHSPAKRWGGVVGGAAGGIAILVAFGAATPATVLAVAVGAPLGDLLESMLKRSRGVKDTGSWLPGFGGLLDRIDSLLITLAVAVVLS